jgi:hypothetical protein
LFTHSICYWKVCIHFRVGGGEEFSAGREFPPENFPQGGKFPGGELVRWNYTLGEFARIPILFIILFFQILLRILFICLAFSFSVSILRVELLRVIVWCKFSPRLNYLDDISMGRGISPWRWDFLVIFKRWSEVK